MMDDKALEPIAEKLADWVIWAQGGVPTETQSRARKASLLSHIMPALREVAGESRREAEARLATGLELLAERDVALDKEVLNLAEAEAEVARLKEQFICVADPAANRIKALEDEVKRLRAALLAQRSMRGVPLSVEAIDEALSGAGEEP